MTRARIRSRTGPWFVALLLGCLLFSPPAVAAELTRPDEAAQAAAQPQPGGVDRATVVLLLRNPTATPGRPGGLDIRTVGEIITSTVFVDGAVEAALGLTPQQWPRNVQLELAPAGDQSIKLIVTVRRSPDLELPEQPATVLQRELVDRARQEVARLVGDQRPELERQIKELQSRREELTARSEALQREIADLRALLGRRGGDSTLGQRQNLRDQLNRNRLRLEALEAMLPKFEALYRDIRSPADDLVELHQRRVALLEEMARDGRASPLDVLEAQIALAEVRSRRVGETDVRTSSLLRYYNEILTLRVEVGVAEIQLAAMGEAPEGPGEREMTPEEAQRRMAELTQEQNEVQRQLNTTNAELQTLQRRLAEMRDPPQLVVIDGSN